MAKASASLSSIMALEEEECGDEALQAALKASMEESGAPVDAELAFALEASRLEAEFGDSQGGGCDDDASLALALALADGEERARDARESSRARASRAAWARNEKVRVAQCVEEEFDAVPSEFRVAAEEDGDDDDVVGGALAAEGVAPPEADDFAARTPGLIGRREDGSLVSKHDTSLDARLKARSLESKVDGVGDMRSAKVNARDYHALVAAQREGPSP